jgi:hypothetical protein
MTQNQRQFIGNVAVALLVSLLGAFVLAQWQVNTQVGQVNNRVGGELYGNNTIGTVRYSAQSQTTLLPSEARYATWRSGALPSEVRMNALAVGPLAPNGAISYIPRPSPLQSAMKTPQPALYTNNYDFVKPKDQLLPTSPGYAASNTIRYSPAAAAAPPVKTGTGQTGVRNIPPVRPVQPSTPSFTPASERLPGIQIDSLNEGSVRYSNLAKPESK